MLNNVKTQICERLFEILSKGVPKLIEAGNYVENGARMIPFPVFTESRDVLSHLRDIASDALNEANVEKNLIEIQEHIRRGIVETYQEHYDYLASNIFQTYGKYKQSFFKFESLLGLRAMHAPLHKNINQVLKSSQNLWIEARNSKTNNFNTSEFEESINKFKKASSLLSSIDEDIDTIFNNFYKRGVITTFIFLFSLSLLVVLLVL